MPKGSSTVEMNAPLGAAEAFGASGRSFFSGTWPPPAPSWLDADGTGVDASWNSCALASQLKSIWRWPCVGVWNTFPAVAAAKSSSMPVIGTEGSQKLAGAVGGADMGYPNMSWAAKAAMSGCCGVPRKSWPKPCWSFCMLAFPTFGASFRSPFRDDGGGVAVWIWRSLVTIPLRAFFTTFPWSLAGGGSTSGEYSRAASAAVGGVGDDGRRLDGSTGGRFGLSAKWLTWVAISAAIPPADNGLFRVALTDGVRKYLATGVNSTYGPWVASRLPGVELKTEYSSAKRGVQPPESSKCPALLFGVSKSGLGKAVEVDFGVCLGVGG